MLIPGIILFFCALLGFFFSKNRLVTFFLAFVVFSFFYFSEDYYDFHNYKNLFEVSIRGSEVSYETGYVWFNNLIWNLGYDYQGLRCAVGLIFVVILYLIINRLTNHPNMVWSAMIIFPAMFDGSLLRNSMSMAISMLGVVSLMNCRNLKQYLIPLSLFILAALFHSSYWVMLLFVPAWIFLNKRKSFKIFVICVFVVYIFSASLSDAIFNIFSMLSVREAAIEKYHTGMYANITGAVYNVVKYLFIMSPVLLFRNWNNSTVPNNSYARDFSSGLFKLNLIFSMILIPQALAVNFSRLFRMIVIFNYAYLGNQLNYSRRNISSRIYAFMYALILLLLLVFFESPTTLYDIIYMHLSTNKFLLSF